MEQQSAVAIVLFWGKFIDTCPENQFPLNSIRIAPTPRLGDEHWYRPYGTSFAKVQEK